MLHLMDEITDKTDWELKVSCITSNLCRELNYLYTYR